ncbi:MAG: PhoPQ-activated protein PqaA family protein [Pseudomonadota bacterium]
MKRPTAGLTTLLFLLFLTLSNAHAVGPARAPTSPTLGNPTLLADYVFTPDPAYAYSLTGTEVLPGATVYTLLMDSLTWRSDEEVDRTLWTHEVVVIVPDEVRANTGFLLINGGSNPEDPVDEEILLLVLPIATSTGTVVSIVSEIPNQPLKFPDQEAAIDEDTLVAYSWDKAMVTGEAAWAAYFPMTKAAVRALDTVQDFTSTQLDGIAVDEFVVTGFSKRGATAWLTAAVDPRVRAVAPGVFDVLDVPLQIERHFGAYGFYSSAIEDYENFEIVRRVRSPEGEFLASIVDPLAYRDTLTVPKLLLNSTGDQFFLPDSANFYLDQLPGETLVRQFPNTDHGLGGVEFELVGDLLGWYGDILAERPRPALQWTELRPGVVTLASEPLPKRVTLWQATNSTARDFRLEVLGEQWTSSAVTALEDGTYRVRVPTPEMGYTGFLLAVDYDREGIGDQTYTTPVFVAPQSLPFDVVDPIGTPRGVLYWACQAAGASACDNVDFTPDELEALLPVSVFGEYISDLASLSEVLLTLSEDPAVKARRACAATRLNIAAGELGWYSSLELGLLGGGPLWRFYGRAEEAFETGASARADRLCDRINRSTE